MMTTARIIMKKHFKNDKHNLILCFISLLLSFFALLVTLNVILNEQNLEDSILRSYPNNHVFSISKNANFTDTKDGYSIIQSVRPTVEEIENLSIFENPLIEIDFSYILDSYEIKKDGLIQNITISFEPHFLEDQVFYYSGFEMEEYVLNFNKDFLLKEDDVDVYETFKLNTSEFEFKKIEVFNFLKVPTVYYPYEVIKNSAKSTYFESINMNLYDFIASKNNNDIETNYSLLIKISQNEYHKFQKSQYIQLYSLTNIPYEICNNFMNLFTSIINFCFYFLVVIVLLVLILFLYILHLTILKNHKEVALLRTYGLKGKTLNLILVIFPILIVFVSTCLPFISILSTSSLINKLVEQSLSISFNFYINLPVNAIAVLLSWLVVFLLVQIPLYKVNKINIRKELNSI